MNYEDINQPQEEQGSNHQPIRTYKKKNDMTPEELKEHKREIARRASANWYNKNKIGWKEHTKAKYYEITSDAPKMKRGRKRQGETPSEFINIKKRGKRPQEEQQEEPQHE